MSAITVGYTVRSGKLKREMKKVLDRSQSASDYGVFVERLKAGKGTSSTGKPQSSSKTQRTLVRAR